MAQRDVFIPWGKSDDGKCPINLTLLEVVITERITIIGIRPRTDSVGPRGNHLRWMFPTHLGFPLKGFTVFRRRTVEEKLQSIQFPAHRVGRKFLPGSVLSGSGELPGMTFHFHDTAHLVIRDQSGLIVENPGATPMRVTFEKPVTYAEIRFESSIDSIKPIELKGYANGRVVAESSKTVNIGEYQAIRLSAPYITSIVFPLNFARLSAVCAQTEEYTSAQNWGDYLVDLFLPYSTNMALERLEADIRNRFVSDRNEARQKYQDKLPELLNWLELLGEPSDSAFTNPGESPDRLTIRYTEGKPHREIRPQSMLLLAALDPNIARFLGLYWVDIDNHTGGPSDGNSYDYKVVGDWGDLTLSGLVLGVGSEKAESPVVQGSVSGEQLRGLRWRGRDPLGGIGIRWKRPVTAASPASAVQPVLYDVYRREEESGNSFELLTEKTPVLVPQNLWGQPDAIFFLDRDLPLGKYGYAVRGVDLFGQVGEAIESEPIEVKDLEAPPPPVRLHAVLKQPGYPWLTSEQRNLSRQPATLELSFEYGEMQYRQAPDAEQFHLHWRADSLFETTRVAITIVGSREVEPETYKYEVRVVPESGNDLSDFVGGFLTNVLPVGPGESGLQVPRRRRYRIEQIKLGNLLELTSTTAAMPEDAESTKWQMVTDPHTLHGWSEPERAETPLRRPITVRPPIEGELAMDAEEARQFTVVVKEVLKKEFRPNPLELLPTGHRPVSEDAPTEPMEVLLDHALYEPDLFTGGTAEIQGQTPFEILYSTSGIAHAEDKTPNKDNTARVGLPAGSSVAPGDRLILRAAEQLQVRYLTISGTVDSAVRIAPGGEIAFDVLQAAQRLTHVARVVSQADQQANSPRFHLLVRFPGRSSVDLRSLRQGRTTCRYYPRYVVTLRVLLQRQTLFPIDPIQPPVFPPFRPPVVPVGTIHLPISSGQGKRMAYFAISAEDPRRNKGPISVPIQVTAVRPPPSTAPLAPFPCNQKEAVAGYASPPDRQGRATVCMEWTAGTSGSAEGLRFEVARALDNSIIATDRRNWLLGLGDAGLKPVAVEINEVRDLSEISVDVTVTPDADRPDYAMEELVGGVLLQAGRIFPVLNAPMSEGGTWVFKVSTKESGVLQPGSAQLYPLPILPGLRLTGIVIGDPMPQPNGTLRVELNVADGSPLETNRLRGGRLYKSLPEPNPPGGPRLATFQVTGAENGDGTLILLLRPMQQTIPGTAKAERYRLHQGSECTIETSPDYSRIVGEDVKLRWLAEKPGNEEAFDLVTGIPIGEAHFRDEIPGIGRNRFFYRVRAVDGAENRSDWSRVGVPFYQVDTTPPEAPKELLAQSLNRSVVLSWQRSADKLISSYRVYRTENGGDSLHGLSNAPYATISSDDLHPCRISLIAGRIVLPQILSINVNPSLVDKHLAEQINTRFVVQSIADDPTGRDFFVHPSDLTRQIGRKIHSLNPLIPDGTPIAIEVGDPLKPFLLTHRPGTGHPLLVENRSVDFSFDLAIDRVTHLFIAEQFPPGTNWEHNDAVNFLEFSDVTVDMDNLVIRGLEMTELKGVDLVAVVRLDDSSQQTIRSMPGKNTPLRLQDKDQLRLDLAPGEDAVHRVYRADLNSDERDLALPNHNAVDLRLTKVSEAIYEKWVSDEEMVTIAVRSLKNLNPLVPSGTEVSIRFIPFKGQPVVISSDPTRLYWIDMQNDSDQGQAVQPLVKYTYSLSAVASVLSAPTEPFSSPVELNIEGVRANPVAAVGMDTSLPPAPRIVALEWFDEINEVPALPNTERPVVRIIISLSAIEDSQFLLQRSSTGAEPWRKVSIQGELGWSNLSSGTINMTYHDQVSPFKTWSYRAMTRTKDGRTSVSSEIRRISALTTTNWA